MKSESPFFPCTITVRTTLEEDGSASMCLMRDGKVVAMQTFPDEDAAMMGLASALLSITCEISVDAVERIPKEFRPYMATTLAALATAAAFDASRLAIENRLQGEDHELAKPKG